MQLQTSFLLTMRNWLQRNFPTLPLALHSRPQPLFLMLVFGELGQRALWFMTLTLNLFSLQFCYALQLGHPVKWDFSFTFRFCFRIFLSHCWFSLINLWLKLLLFCLFNRFSCPRDSSFFLCFKVIGPTLLKFIFTFFNCVLLTLPHLKCQSHHLLPRIIFLSLLLFLSPPIILMFIFCRVVEFVSLVDFIWECWVLRVEMFLSDWIWGASPWRVFNFGDVRYWLTNPCRFAGLWKKDRRWSLYWVGPSRWSNLFFSARIWQWSGNRLLKGAASFQGSWGRGTRLRWINLEIFFCKWLLLQPWFRGGLWTLFGLIAETGFMVWGHDGFSGRCLSGFWWGSMGGSWWKTSCLCNSSGFSRRDAATCKWPQKPSPDFGACPQWRFWGAGLLWGLRQRYRFRDLPKRCTRRETQQTSSCCLGSEHRLGCCRRGTGRSRYVRWTLSFNRRECSRSTRKSSCKRFVSHQSFAPSHPTVLSISSRRMSTHWSSRSGTDGRLSTPTVKSRCFKDWEARCGTVCWEQFQSLTLLAYLSPASGSPLSFATGSLLPRRIVTLKTSQELWSYGNERLWKLKVTNWFGLVTGDMLQMVFFIDWLSFSKFLWLISCDT